MYVIKVMHINVVCICRYMYLQIDIIVKGAITILNTVAAGAVINYANRKVIYKNCAPLTNCLS